MKIRFSKKMEKNPVDEEQEEPKQPPSLFPLLPISNTTPKPTISTTTISSTYTSQSLWLYNSSFTADLSAINDTVSNLYHPQPQEDDDEEDREEDHVVHRRGEEEPRPVYEPLESSDSDKGDSGEKRRKDGKMKKRKKKRKRQQSSDDGLGGFVDSEARKCSVRAWVDSGSKPSKDYYFDSRGDLDNSAFGCLYRMDVARYKPHSYVELCEINFQGLRRRNWTNLMLDKDGDIDALDSKLKFGGRYWSAKYMAFEGHKDLKRIRNAAPYKFQETVSDDFISLADVQDSVIEESWEDEVLCKTREFNKLTQERPNDGKVWLEFAEFQDRLAGKQPQKGARLQILEKKISILEKAVELNPDNEEILLFLLRGYQSRDNSDVLIGRWEKILMQHPSSFRLWKEFLHVVQGEFSKFKVSEIRKMYAAAIQALSAACSKHSRQVHQEAKSPTLDSTVVELELGLVDIFLSLCRLEWHAGYQELATGLFQAEIEYSLFTPSLLLTDQSKHRLFEHFWKGEFARVGEDGALGWCTWLTKEEESRQSSHDVDEGGWTGWLEPFSKIKESAGNPDNEANSDMEVDESQLVLNGEDVKEEDDAEALLKKLGIDVDAGISGEVKDTSTWRRWSEEELSRDCDQWMPLHTKSGGSDGTPDADEHLLRVIMYEDVNEYLFSLNTSEARFSLVSQFIDFFGGKISQGICTNSSTWIEKTISLVDLPHSLAQILERVHNILHKSQNTSRSTSLESLLGSTNDIFKLTDMMKFLRNAILLCLTAFPRNHILEEAALVAEELSVTKMNSSGCSVTPCRALAKSLLKSDRQDLLLCGVYARREAFYGNMDYARKVFDMALLSIEGLPREQQSNAPLLYLWYAELECANTPSDDNESSFRAIHILSCFGSNVIYVPFKRQPSSLQLLKAHQGFQERIKIVQSAWVRGVIDEQSIAVVCASALFEELTSGWAAAIEVLDRVLKMVLPERRSNSYEMELLFKFYVRMLERHHHQLSLSKCWESIFRGLQIFPFSPELYSALVEIGNLHTTPNRLRWMLDDYCHKKQSVVVWLFTLTFEISRGGSQHRIHGMFERALAVDRFHKSVLLWRCYIAYELTIACNPSAARRVFFRAIHACPWSKKLWLDGFLKLSTILSAKEMSDLQEVMRDKELNLRTDIYEILLQDEHVP